jgi:hypothetical protein
VLSGGRYRGRHRAGLSRPSCATSTLTLLDRMWRPATLRVGQRAQLVIALRMLRTYPTVTALIAVGIDRQEHIFLIRIEAITRPALEISHDADWLRNQALEDGQRTKRLDVLNS